MPNRIIIPFLNSVKFVKRNLTLLPQYDKQLFDYSFFEDQQYEWQQQSCYAIKRTTYDADHFQFLSNYDPIQIEIRRRYDDALMISTAAQRIRRSRDMSDYYIYQVDISYATLPIGLYYMLMTVGTTEEYESEDIQILSSPKNTVYVEYSNSEYYEQVLFETGIVMSARFEGGVMGYNPAGRSVVYQDQVMNETLLSYKPYETWKLIAGGPFGIPDYAHKLLNRIVGCDNLRINGQYYSMIEGAKWEKFEEERYNLRGWSLEIGEQLNRSSVIYDSATEVGKKLMIVNPTETKGFGDLSENAGSNIVPVVGIE